MPVLKSNKILISLLILLMGFIVSYYGFILLQPASELLDTKVEKIIHIESGSTVDKIASQLKEEEIIVDPLIFKFYLQFRGLSQQLRAGHYRLSSEMTISQIIDKLVAGKMASYKLTVPEGVTVENIAQRLEKEGIKKEVFLEIARKKGLKFLSRSQAEKDEIIYSLEGFLFPDTYQIPYGSSAQEIVAIMVQGFKERIEILQSEIDESAYNTAEIITIASLIQAEGRLDNELPIISSVIYNRLDRGMKLQIDATIQYILPERKARLLYSDLKVDSAYNTYLNHGLPPGPINNPGLKAIKAALRPAETDYLYYVAIGDGEHKFTKTYREHLRVQRRLKDN